jgi:hypothetical protein
MWVSIYSNRVLFQARTMSLVLTISIGWLAQIARNTFFHATKKTVFLTPPY